MENSNTDMSMNEDIENLSEDMSTNEETENIISNNIPQRTSMQDVIKNHRAKQFAIIALSFAIIGYFMSCMCTVLGVALAIGGIVFAILAKDANGKRNLFAIMAIIISVVAVITGVSGTIANIITMMFDETFIETYKEIMQGAMETETTANLY